MLAGREANGNAGAAMAPVQLALYDDRRAAAEDDDPAEQLLAFHPAAAPPEEQASAAGLIRAVSAFTSIFTEDVATDLAMDATQRRWVTHAAEPHLSLLLVADAAWCGTLVRDAELRGVLLQVHAAMRLLHGSVQRLLDEVGPDAARGALGAVLHHYGAALASGGASHVLEPGNPLSAAGGGVPLFPLSRRTLTGLHALCDGLLLLPLAPGPSPSGSGGGGAVSGVVAMHGRHCLCSSVGRGDTSALAALATGALLQHSAAGQSAWKKLKGAALATAGRSPSPAKQRPSRLPLDASAWTGAGDGFLHLAARAAGSSPAAESSVAASVESTPRSDGEGGADKAEELSLPLIHLQSGERCRLLPLQRGEAVLLLAMAEEWRASPEAVAAVAAAAGPPLQRLAAAVAAEVSSARDCHVKGFRYLHTDGVLGVTRASPSVKTATLAHDSAALAASVRRQMDEVTAGSSGPEDDADVEVVVRGVGDCWVAGRAAGRRSLVVVLEGRGEGGLQEATATAARFAAEQFPGIY